MNLRYLGNRYSISEIAVSIIYPMDTKKKKDMDILGNRTGNKDTHNSGQGTRTHIIKRRNDIIIIKRK